MSNKPTKSALDKIDAESLAKLIKDAVRDVSETKLEFEAAKKIALRELCVLFGAGSEKLGREVLLKLLTEMDETERTRDARAALDEMSAKLRQGKHVDLRMGLDDLSRALTAKDAHGN